MIPALELIGLILCVAGGVSCAAGPGRGRSRELRALVDADWRERLQDDPLFATAVGRHELDDRLADVSPRALERRARRARRRLDALHRIEIAELGPEERATHAVLEGLLAERIADFEFGAWMLPFNADSGFHTDFADLPQQMTCASVSDYEHYVARLDAWPAHVSQQIANLRAGIARGVTLPGVVLAGYEVTMSSHVVQDPTQSVFWAPFADFPRTVPVAERERLATQGRRAISASVAPAYADLLRFFEDEYLPAARSTLGASDLPVPGGGRAWYAHLVERFTTLELTPEEVHATGLAEVARIRAEMEDVVARTGFDGDFAEFLTFLRTDPRFYARTPEELLAHASRIAKRMDGALPALFGRLPRLPYGVAPVPAHLAPKYTSGRYVAAPAGSTAPGWYWVNTYALENRPLYVFEALTLHEAVPGHHLQIALAQEDLDLPEFRRHVYHPAYGEGWALYAERLGLEVGFYSDPYADFGRLSYEMWRAARLVVDTGLHAFGWTRERAIDYLASNTALSLHECTTEIDRYISWPGQALAYKIGELEIRRLRAEAEAALGEAFDLRAFHDAVLATGSVPLPTLRREIERFVEEQAAVRHRGGLARAERERGP